jgi:Anti-sigma-28 factor, FlgM
VVAPLPSGSYEGRGCYATASERCGAHMTFWIGRGLLKRNRVFKRGVLVAQQYAERRAARIEQLREEIRSSSYRVDSMALARRMLTNEAQCVEACQE